MKVKIRYWERDENKKLVLSDYHTGIILGVYSNEDGIARILFNFDSGGVVSFKYTDIFKCETI